jgi:hypothetical protein
MLLSTCIPGKKIQGYLGIAGLKIDGPDDVVSYKKI